MSAALLKNSETAWFINPVGVSVHFGGVDLMVQKHSLYET